MTVYANPGTEGSIVNYKDRYDNYIGGQWVPPVDGEYLDNVTPITGEVFCQVARGKAADVEKALDAAHKAAPAWGKTSPAERALILHRIADRMEEHLEEIAVAETWENGKAVRETLAADIPLAIDHFRYFAGATRAQEGRLSQIDHDTVAYHFHEPLGVVGQIIPWNFPILMATWKIAPALAAGNAIVLKPAEQTPASLLYLVEIIQDLLPAGVLNIVNGLGEEAGVALSSSDRIAKIAFTGSTSTGRMIAQAAANSLIPATLELGGKSPNIFFADVMDRDDAFLDKAIEGLVLFAFNQGEVCTCPSRALIQNSILEQFLPDQYGNSYNANAGVWKRQSPVEKRIRAMCIQIVPLPGKPAQILHVETHPKTAVENRHKVVQARITLKIEHHRADLIKPLQLFPIHLRHLVLADQQMHRVVAGHKQIPLLPVRQVVFPHLLVALKIARLNPHSIDLLKCLEKGWREVVIPNQDMQGFGCVMDPGRKAPDIPRLDGFAYVFVFKRPGAS